MLIKLSLIFLAGYAFAEDNDTRILKAIGQVETGMDYKITGDGGKALGAYQLHVNAWNDANLQLMREGLKTYPVSDWRNQKAQDAIGLAYLRFIKSRLRSAGVYSPTVQQIALCWNKGFVGAYRLNFNHKLASGDYSERVFNIYASKI